MAVTVSLCCIVKNDRLLVKRMLDSAVDAVDEIVIADTGSTDDTVEVIRSFCSDHPGLVKLLHFDWVNDFAAARNFTLEHASGDWILVVDADEFIDAKEKLKLHSFLESSGAEGVFITQRNYAGTLTNLTCVSDIEVVRLFRRGYRYRDPVHEQVAVDIVEHGGKLAHFALHLHHVGYTREYGALKAKGARNRDLLSGQLQTLSRADKEERWFATTNLMAEYVGAGEWQAVIDCAPSIIHEIKSERRDTNFLSRAYMFYITALRNVDRRSDAVRVSREAIRLFPALTDVRVALAETFLQGGDYRQAIKELLVCRDMGDVKFNLVEHMEGAGTYHAARLLGHCWFRLGDNVSANEWFVTSYRENPQQAFLLPIIVMLNRDHDVLVELQRGILTPQRYGEFLNFYGPYGYDDTLAFVAAGDANWGPSEPGKRARFAYAVKAGVTPELPAAASEFDYGRMGLYAYERGQLLAAQSYWQQAGAVGEFFTVMSSSTSDKMNWKASEVLPDLLAAHSVQLLRTFGSRIADMDAAFPLLLHTDLLTAFTGEAYLEAPGRCTEEWEWKAQVYLTQGRHDKATAALQMAVLPDGNLTVRGYMIRAELEADRRREIIREARRLYPASRLLSHLWLTHFVPQATNKMM